jgi:hypothetical protein
MSEGGYRPSLAGWLARMAQRSSVRATTVDAL